VRGGRHHQRRHRSAHRRAGAGRSGHQPRHRSRTHRPAGEDPAAGLSSERPLRHSASRHRQRGGLPRHLHQLQRHDIHRSRGRGVHAERVERRRHRGPRRLRLADVGPPVFVRDWREMSDKYTDPALLRGLTQSRIGRRGLLSAATASAAALGLAACGVKGKAKGTASAAPDAVAKYWAGKTSTGHVNFANWPLYMDPKKPELAQFTKDTGVTVTYKEVINDLASWFAKVQPQLSAGQSIGYDIMVITNGSQFKDFVQLGLFAPLDHSKLPNYAANAAPKYKEEAFD